MKYFLGLDVETGGIADDKSLLTAYFGFYELVNDNFNKLDELDLKIKPNDNVYHLTAESLDINKINIIEHNKVAIFEKIAGQQLYKKLQDWFNVSKGKLIPVGHNVNFDIRKVTTTLISLGSWENFVSYRLMDTCTIAQFYRICGKLPDDLSCSLGHLAGYYKVYSSGKQHEAKCDVELTMGVLKNLMKNA
jgi:hypothetical protein